MPLAGTHMHVDPTRGGVLRPTGPLRLSGGRDSRDDARHDLLRTLRSVAAAKAQLACRPRSHFDWRGDQRTPL